MHKFKVGDKISLNSETRLYRLRYHAQIFCYSIKEIREDGDYTVTNIARGTNWTGISKEIDRLYVLATEEEIAHAIATRMANI